MMVGELLAAVNPVLQAGLRLIKKSSFRGWPQACVLCGEPAFAGRLLCGACHADLAKNLVACPGCALPLPAISRPHRCGRCLSRPPVFDQAVAPLRYQGTVEWLVRRFKYAGDLRAGRALGLQLAEAVRQTGHSNDIDLLVPVPLHDRRLRERGFNQALELARVVGARLRRPVRWQGLRRHRVTREQVALSGTARRQNVAGAFSATDTFSGLAVAVIDDVMTTGSTVNEVSRVLKRAGARRVEVWSVARAG